MKLHEHRQPQLNLISRYGEGRVIIEGREITAPCIVAPGTVLTEWITSTASLTLESVSYTHLTLPTICSV